ncbi:MAG: tetratricopeptide repeat protein [Pseudomonadota bacterium]
MITLGLDLSGCSTLDVFDSRQEPAPVVDSAASSKPGTPQTVTPPPPKATDVQLFAYGETTRPDGDHGSLSPDAGILDRRQAVSSAWQSIPDEPVRRESHAAVSIPPPAVLTDPGGDEAHRTEVRDTQVAMREPAARPSLPQSGPVAQLIAESERLHKEGNPTRAAASLERALRIEPNNAEIYHRLARIRLDQGQYAQAIELASRSTSLAGTTSALARDNWRISAAARAKLGATVPAAR